MANLSLNQQVKELREHAEAHPQLYTVLFEPPVDSLDRGDIKYPAFLFKFNGSRKEGDTLVRRFTGWVLDMMLKEADNEQEVWSDTEQIACDMIAFMDDADRVYRLDGNVELRALSGVEPDLLSGFMFDFTLRQRFPAAVCVEPTIGTDDFNDDFNDDFADNDGNTGSGDFNDDFNNDF